MVLSFEVFPLKPDAPIDTIPIGLQRISHSLWTQYFRIPQMMYLSYKFLFIGEMIMIGVNTIFLGTIFQKSAFLRIR